MEVQNGETPIWRIKAVSKWLGSPLFSMFSTIFLGFMLKKNKSWNNMINFRFLLETRTPCFFNFLFPTQSWVKLLALIVSSVVCAICLATCWCWCCCSWTYCHPFCLWTYFEALKLPEKPWTSCSWSSESQGPQAVMVMGIIAIIIAIDPEIQLAKIEGSWRTTRCTSLSFPQSQVFEPATASLATEPRTPAGHQDHQDLLVGNHSQKNLHTTGILGGGDNPTYQQLQYSPKKTPRISCFPS